MNKQKELNLKVKEAEFAPSSTRIRLFAVAIYPIIEEFFKNPANMQAFEEWRKTQSEQ